MNFRSPKLSLADMLGESFLQQVVQANVALGRFNAKEADALAHEKVDFFPENLQKQDEALLKQVGTQIVTPFNNTVDGAPTDAFRKATHKSSAPITGAGCFRIGEDGRLYLIGKSEHYHASLGHKFNGYRLVDNARALGLLNATHNNTRGYVTRLLETRLIQSANGIDWEDEASTAAVVASKEPHVLNRVISLETGSLAVEAGVKMMLARFYRLDNTFSEPKYSGRIPVFFVMADNDGGKAGNYHGTTVLTQTFRGLWPELCEEADTGNLYKVVPVAINDISYFESKMEKYNIGKYKTAGFIHEIVMMNYGGIRLTEEFLQSAYACCRRYDTPTMVDEIQSCMWYKGMFLYRLYGLKPDFAIIGKGFPGGEYSASKILTTAEMDTLNQFGALVTNGQEELASLSYLITMTFMQANGDFVEKYGNLLMQELCAVQQRHPEALNKVEGRGHLIGLQFADVTKAAEFSEKLNARYIDSSAQLYKANCPPAVLIKPPVISSEATVRYIAAVIDELL